MSDPFKSAQKYANAHRSWGKGFRRAVMLRRASLAQESPHLVIAWLLAVPALDKAAEIKRRALLVKCHAPWLNHEAIAYRAAMGSPKYNGFYIS